MNWRYYFNRHNEAPQVWSIDSGTQTSEFNVITVVIHPGVMTHTGYDPTCKVNPDTPCAWVDIFDADIIMDRGEAHFFPSAPKRF